MAVQALRNSSPGTRRDRTEYEYEVERTTRTCVTSTAAACIERLALGEEPASNSAFVRSAGEAHLDAETRSIRSDVPLKRPCRFLTRTD